MDFDWALLTLLVIGFILLFWFIFFLKRLIFFPLKRKHLRENSTLIVPGKIQSKKEIRKQFFGSGKIIQINVEFNNLNGSKINHDFNFVDRHPEQHRFEKGNPIQVKLTENVNYPVFLNAPVYQRSLLAQFTRVLILGGYVAGVFFALSSMLKIANYNWDEFIWRVDDKITPLLGGIYIGTMFFIGLVFRAVGLIESKKKKKHRYHLKYEGKWASAKVLNYEGTGTRINNNPQVKVTYEFDVNGRIIEGTTKFVMDEVKVGTLTNMQEINVLYLPNDPAVNESEMGLKNNFLGGCVGGIFYFIAFVFSAVVFGLFIGTYFY